MNEELDLYLTRKIVDVVPNSVIVKRTGVDGEKKPCYYLKIPGKSETLLARGFRAAKQAIQVYRDNVVASKGAK